MSRFRILTILGMTMLFISSCQKEAPIISISDSRFSFTREGGSQTFSFICNRDWTISSSEAWLRVSPSSGSVRDADIIVTVICSPNETSNSRKATVSVMADERQETLTVFQVPYPNGAVDLGLSVYWASCNLGATTQEGFGDSYAWGETVPKEDYTWSTYKWCTVSDDQRITLTKYNVDSNYGIVDNKTVLDPEDDAAYIVLGDYWRIPTDAEWAELLEKCTWELSTQSGVNGYLVTSNKNGESIFLPDAGTRFGTDFLAPNSYGDYWSSSLNPSSPIEAGEMAFDTSTKYWGTRNRCGGHSIRPVTK